MEKQFEVTLDNKEIIIKTGKLAKQASGSVLVQQGGTVVLVTAVSSDEPKQLDMLPLTVDYREKTYAAGKVPGGFFKREGRPTEKEILTCRLIDRPIRSLFPKGFRYELQIMANVLSSDGECDSDVLALYGASCALAVSDIPFDDLLGACRIIKKGDDYILNPSFEETAESTLDIVIAASKKGVVMAEAEAKEISEDELFNAMKYAYEKLQPLIDIQTQLSQEAGKAKREIVLAETDPALIEEVTKLSDTIKTNLFLPTKAERSNAKKEILSQLTEKLVSDENPDNVVTEGDVMNAYYEVEKKIVRKVTANEKKRIDGRAFDEIRNIDCEVGVLPRTHGCGLFTRGETQSLAVTTLGTASDEQTVESLEGSSSKSFMLHYNFPPFSVGEARPVRGPGRREIGHGALAEKALRYVMPDKDRFPYTVRLVSEILESNGSSSMASVCAGTLALMDAGVPISAPVSGIAMGLIKEGDQVAILTDIAGAEDHCGDMDFKVTGTAKGITALQIDIKISHLTDEIIKNTLSQAREARMYILNKITETIASPRSDLSAYAPRIIKLEINPEKIKDVIGPGGKVIKKIIADTGASIDIDDTGVVLVASVDEAAAAKAIEIISKITEEPEVGKIYHATVKRIMNFGAFCEILPGKEGLVHVSELSNKYIESVEDAVKLGDEFNVKLIKIDDQGRLNLSRKQAEEKPAEDSENNE